MVIEYYFDCPACDLTVNVDTPTYEILLEEGCILCENLVTEDAFQIQRNAEQMTTPKWIR